MNNPDGLGYEDELVVAWEPGAAAGDEVLQRANADAARLLRALAALEDTSRESVRDTSEEISNLHQEFHRLEGKVDLMLNLVANLANAGLSLPAPCTVMVRATGIQWQQPPSALALSDGEQGMAAIYLYPGLPLPVTLPATVKTSDRGSPALTFTDLTSEVRNALERHVFRHHRRAVARAAAERSE